LGIHLVGFKGKEEEEEVGVEVVVAETQQCWKSRGREVANAAHAYGDNSFTTDEGHTVAVTIRFTLE